MCDSCSIVSCATGVRFKCGVYGEPSGRGRGVGGGGEGEWEGEGRGILTS